MVNYQNGKIYRIVCNTTGKQYIGATCMSLTTLLYHQKKLFKDGKSGISKLVLEHNDCNIVLLEDFPCDRKELLLQRHRFYVETMDCVNKKVPTRTPQEWYEENKELQFVWNNTNKDKLKEYQKTGLLVDLTEVNVNDEENIKLNIEDIYSNELTNDEIYSYIETQFNNKSIL